MEYQMRNWYYFIWLCGDHIVEQHIHNLDVSNWLKERHPVKASGMGGCARSQRARTTARFSTTTASSSNTPTARGCSANAGTSPAAGQRIGARHRHQRHRGAAAPMTYRPTGGQNWRHTGRGDKDPYQVEHDDLFAAIREGKPYNEAEYGATSTMTAILGRMATYCGKAVTWDDAINSKISVMPSEYAWNATPPVVPVRTACTRRLCRGCRKWCE